MKPENWISPTGFSPCAAIPTHNPLMSSSASGVSITRSLPKRCCKPAVARNTPPLTPISSPSRTTSGSSASARASARLMDSTSVTSGIAVLAQAVALCRIGSRQPRIEMIEDGGRLAWHGREIFLHRLVDAFLALGCERFFLALAPGSFMDEAGAQSGDRVLLPTGLDFLRRAITRRIVGGGVVAQAIGKRLDQGRSAAFTCARDGLMRRGMHRDGVVAVDLLAGEPGSDRL